MMRGRRVGRRTHRFNSKMLIFGACAVAALVLSLGVSGTLSSWTSAVLTNSTNTTATATAVILRETSGATTCTSSDSPTTNVSTCATINKYGGTSSPLMPGAAPVTTTVTFTNLGAAPASSFVLAPGTCSSTPSTGTPTPTPLCTATGELTVSVNCSDGSSYVAGSKWADLTYSGVPGSMGSLTHTATLAAGASWTCQFGVSLPASASVLDQGITVTQPLTWTLNK